MASSSATCGLEISECRPLIGCGRRRPARRCARSSVRDHHHCFTMTPGGDPPPAFAVAVSPLTGRSYRATRDLPAEYCLLDVPTPYACTVYKQFRTEVCAECWRYECGRRGFLTCRDNADAGLMFCDHACRDAWLEREGEDTVQMLKILEGARRRNDKGEANESVDTAAAEVTEETIAHAWEAVALEEKRPKVLNRWKQIQLDDFEADLARYVLLALIHMYRESQSNHTFPDKAHSVARPVSFGGATWSDFAALQSGELQQVARFPELLQNHIRIYQVLKSRFSSAPPSHHNGEPARAADAPPRLGDVITTTHVRVALAVDPGNSFGVWQVPVTEESEGLGFGVYPIPSFFNHRKLFCNPRHLR